MVKSLFAVKNHCDNVKNKGKTERQNQEKIYQKNLFAQFSEPPQGNEDGHF